MSAKSLGLQFAVTLLAATASIGLYHYFVLSKSLRFGVVNVSEAYRLKEKQLIDMVAKPGVTDADRQRVTALAMEFAKTLPAVLEQLPKDCGCVVLVSSAVITNTSTMIDLTPTLKKKIGI